MTEGGENGVITSLGRPVVLHWTALALVCRLMLFSAYQRRLPLLVFSVCFLGLALVSLFWSWQSLRKVAFRITLSRNRAFPGEDIELSLEVSNEKLMPLSWLSIEKEIPFRLAKGPSIPPSPFSIARLRWVTSISGRQQIRWKHSLECRARGDYRLGPVRMRSGDIFGCFPKELLLPGSETLLVYPRIVPIDKFNLPLMGLVGERETKGSVHVDLSRIVGTRPYHRDDPFKRIHWKASARNGRLRSKQYESTTSLSLLLVLDVQSFCHQESETVEPFELAVSVTASFANMAFREKFSVGLMANAVPEVHIPLSSGHGQLLMILEALARVEPKSLTALHDQLDRNNRSLTTGTTLVIVTHMPSPAIFGVARKLKQQGIQLLLLTVGDKKVEKNPWGIPMISVMSLGDLCQNPGARSI